MFIVETRIVEWLRIGAITFFPFVFVAPGRMTPRLRLHERCHWEQQRRWAIYGLGVGLILWFAIYLLALPVGWNPLRRKWETEAYKTAGMSLETINAKLRKWPYLLRW